MIMRERLEKDGTPIRCPIFLDRECATFHVVFMFGLRCETFKGLSSVVGSMQEGIGDEVMIRRLDDSVVHVAGLMVKIGIAPVVRSIPVSVIIKLRDVVVH